MLVDVATTSRDESSTSVLRRLLAVAAVLALLLPSVGPLIDHHFVERQAHHEHISFSGLLSNHSHSYGLDHSHQPGVLTGRAAPTEGPVMLTSQDAAAGGIALLSSVSTDTEMAFPGRDDSWLLFHPSDHDRVLAESFVSLPKKPPRA